MPTSVRVEKTGPVTTVILHRPEVRNAVDPATARLLLEAFQDFDADPNAHAMGLANRLAPDGHARAAAEELALQIASLPQTCLREDRMSVLEQHGLSEEEALRNELRPGQVSVVESLDGAQRFASGAGRHG